MTVWTYFFLWRRFHGDAGAPAEASTRQRPLRTCVFWDSPHTVTSESSPRAVSIGSMATNTVLLAPLVESLDLNKAVVLVPPPPLHVHALSGNLLVIAFVSYFGAKLHRPKIIAIGCVLMSLGTFLIAMPHFIIGRWVDWNFAKRTTKRTRWCSVNG